MKGRQEISLFRYPGERGSHPGLAPEAADATPSAARRTDRSGERGVPGPLPR
jgi:hypothetical protein